MSIQRWTFINGAEPHWLEEHPMGEYVTYADHVAAVAAAQREGANQGYLNGVATNADNSFKAGVKAAREAVAAAYEGHFTENGVLHRDADPATGLRALDALIDALEKP